MMIILILTPITATQKLYIAGFLNTKQQREVVWVEKSDSADVIIVSKGTDITELKLQNPKAEFISVKGSNVEKI